MALSKTELTRLAKLRVNNPTWLDYYKRSTAGSITAGNYRTAYAPTWLNKVNGQIEVLMYTLSQHHDEVYISRIDNENYSQSLGHLPLKEVLTEENQIILGLKAKPAKKTSAKKTTTLKTSTAKKSTKKKTAEEDK